MDYQTNLKEEKEKEKRKSLSKYVKEEKIN
jgi:hypothetical protein